MSRGFRSVVMISIAATLAIPGFTSAGMAATGTIIDEGWVPSRTLVSGGHQAVRFRDVAEYNERISTLLARTPRWKICTTTTAVPCSTATTIEFSSVLQPCSNPTQLDCIVAFGTVSTDGTKSPATYDGAFPKTAPNGFEAEPNIGLPAGGAGGLWTVAEGSGAPIRTHYVGVTVSGSAKPGERVAFGNFFAMASPIGIKTFSCNVPAGCSPSYVPERDDSSYVGYVDGFGVSLGLNCVMSGNYDASTGKSECAERKAFSKDVNYYLTVRLSQAVSGWLHGRLADPNITIESVAGSTSAVTVSIAAKSVSVPAVDLEKNFSDLPATLQDAYRAKGAWKDADPAGYGNFAFETDPLKRNKESRPTSSGVNSIAELEAWIPVINDTAIADLSTWTVRTLGSNELGAASGCVTDKNKVTGIVTTNATVYKAAAPVYDSATQSLNYTVSAPHYMSSGELFKGSYSLIVRSDVARCIYKFTSAPIKSTIEVIDTGAETNSVVTNVSESDGWIRLTASGFTHSTPTIRATMTQPATTEAAQPTIALNRGASRASLLKWAALTTTKTSRVTLTVAKSSRRICAVSGTSIMGRASGTCVVSIRVQTGSKRSSATLRIRVG